MPPWSAARACSMSLLQVGELAFAEEFGEQHGVVAGAGERGVEQRGDRHAVFDRAEMARALRRRRRLSRASSGESSRRQRFGEQAGVEAAGGVGEPEQRFVGEREERAAEDAGEADFVGGAGDGAEQVEHVEDFLLGVERVAADEVVVEAVFAEGFFVELARR